MNLRQHTPPTLGRAARAARLTVIFGFGYPLMIWLVALLPGLHDKAEGSILTAGGKPVGSKLIGQLFTDASATRCRSISRAGHRPPAATATTRPPASGSSLGPGEHRRHAGDPAKLAAGASPSDAGFKPSLLTQVCSRSAAIGQLEGVDGSRPFCTGGGVGAVLSVIGPRDSRGYVIHPARVVSVNEPCSTTKQPFLDFYEGVRVECAKFDEDYSIGQIVPIRGSAPEHPQVPADAVTASGSGLDPRHLAGLRRHPGRPGGQGTARQPGSDTRGPGAVPHGRIWDFSANLL